MTKAHSMTQSPIDMSIEALENMGMALTMQEEPLPDIDDINEALTALRQHQQDGGWLPIETAPKDGTRVLLLHCRYGAGSGHFDGKWHLHFCLNKLAIPDAWQPLPPAPKKESDDND